MSELFHEGERRAQALAREERAAARNGRAIADAIVRGALPFVAAQPMLVVATETAATEDASGQPCASVLFGPPGFVTATEHDVAIDLARADPDPVVAANAHEGSPVGLLAIELATRRRFRVNGRIASSAGGVLRVPVSEAFPNCPAWITRRRLFLGPRTSEAAPARSGARLDDGARALVARSDTVFVASRHPTRGLDASHRGGPRGFVSIEEDRLVIPDYSGNSMFKTIGNLLVDPRVGLALLDFESGRLLAIAGRATVAFDRPDPRNVTGGSGRFLEVAIDHWTERSVHRTLRWEELDARADG